MGDSVLAAVQQLVEGAHQLLGRLGAPTSALVGAEQLALAAAGRGALGAGTGGSRLDLGFDPHGVRQQRRTRAFSSGSATRSGTLSASRSPDSRRAGASRSSVARSARSRRSRRPPR